MTAERQFLFSLISDIYILRKMLFSGNLHDLSADNSLFGSLIAQRIELLSMVSTIKEYKYLGVDFSYFLLRNPAKIVCSRYLYFMNYIDTKSVMDLIKELFLNNFHLHPFIEEWRNDQSNISFSWQDIDFIDRNLNVLIFENHIQIDVNAWYDLNSIRKWINFPIGCTKSLNKKEISDLIIVAINKVVSINREQIIKKQVLQ